MNIAIFFNAGDLSGGGGVERFFLNFISEYNKIIDKKYNLKLIIDHESYDRAIESMMPIDKKNTIFYKTQNNRFKEAVENFRLFTIIILNRIKIFQFSNYQLQDIFRVKFIKKIPRFIKPLTILTIVDCQVFHELTDKYNKKHNYSYNRFIVPIKSELFNGVYTWYENMNKYIKENYSDKVYSESIKRRFVKIPNNIDISKKQKIIIFAARLSEQKRPMWLLEAINIIVNRKKQQLHGWTFVIYGKGEQKAIMKQYIEVNKLHNVVQMKESSFLWDVFAYTKCFISTQDYENFPSNSMMEAMSCGNAIIARNVGQTNWLVKNKINGLLLEKDSPDGLADKIIEYLKMEDTHPYFEQESIQIMHEIHTFNLFRKDFEIFWNSLLQKTL